MVQVSYALREDANSILLLQDAGRRYNRYCQITVFGRNIVRPEFFRQYLYFAPFTGANGKYRGSVTDVQMSIEDNDYAPMRDYVAVIDSEVEFKVTPSVIRQLSRDHMPAWGVKSYLDYFTDRKSGTLLFLRVYRVNQALSPYYFGKGVRGSSQVLKLYDEQGEEVSLPVDVIEPVISDYKFLYLKDEILHLLKVENSLIAQYDNTERGLSSLQERVIADRYIQGTKERWKDRHLQWVYRTSDEDDGFDMAQLDYEAIYDEVLEISPGMYNIIEYVRTIQAARLGEYDYYLKDIHTHSENKKSSFDRLFEMSLRVAVKNALYYHKRHKVDLEDSFQEACIGIITAIQKHNDNVAGLFPSYVAMWIRQVLNRDLSPYDDNVRVPIQYSRRIDQTIQQLSSVLKGEDFREMDHNELFYMLLKYTDCDEKEAFRLTYILSPAESIEEIIEDPQREDCLANNQNIHSDDIVLELLNQKNLSTTIEEILSSLSEREASVIKMRYGIGYDEPMTLEAIGSLMNVTRERIRQIEAKAMSRLEHPSQKKKLKGYL